LGPPDLKYQTLPPAMPELNAVESVFAIAKSRVAKEAVLRLGGLGLPRSYLSHVLKTVLADENWKERAESLVRKSGYGRTEEAGGGGGGDNLVLPTVENQAARELEEALLQAQQAADERAETVRRIGLVGGFSSRYAAMASRTAPRSVNDAIRGASQGFDRRHLLRLANGPPA